MNYSYDEYSRIKNQMEVDHKIVKRIYPRTNNQTTLEFILEKDPNLFLRMHTMKLFFRIKIPEGYSPDLAIGPKQFSDLRIEFNSQMVNSSSTKWVLICFNVT